MPAVGSETTNIRMWLFSPALLQKVLDPLIGQTFPSIVALVAGSVRPVPAPGSEREMDQAPSPRRIGGRYLAFWSSVPQRAAHIPGPAIAMTAAAPVRGQASAIRSIARMPGYRGSAAAADVPSGKQTPRMRASRREDACWRWAERLVAGEGGGAELLHRDAVDEFDEFAVFLGRCEVHGGSP